MEWPKIYTHCIQISWYFDPNKNMHFVIFYGKVECRNNFIKTSKNLKIFLNGVQQINSHKYSSKHCRTDGIMQGLKKQSLFMWVNH